MVRFRFHSHSQTVCLLGLAEYTQSPEVPYGSTPGECCCGTQVRVRAQPQVRGWSVSNGSCKFALNPILTCEIALALEKGPSHESTWS